MVRRGRVGLKKPLGGHELEEDAAVEQQQQAGVAGLVLKGQEAFGGRKQLDAVDGPADAFEELGAVGLKVDAAVHEQVEIGENVLDGPAGAGREAVEIHLHPGRNARNQGHFLAQRFVHDAFELGFPVLDDVGGVAGQLVAAQVGRHVVVGNARKPAGADAVVHFQLRRARQEYQLAIEKLAAAGAVDVVQQRIAGAVDVVAGCCPS